MTNKPIAITPEEFEEIASSPEFQELWGVDSTAEAMEMLKSDYIVKFNYVEGTQGYVGDLFVIQVDCLDSEIPATRMFRGSDNQLVILR